MIEFLMRAEKAWPGDTPTTRQLMVLIYLHGKAPTKTRVVADALGIQRPSLTRAHQALKKLGLLRQQRSTASPSYDGDGRDSFLSLTVAGQAFVEGLGLENAKSVPALGRGL